MLVALGSPPSAPPVALLHDVSDRMTFSPLHASLGYSNGLYFVGIRAGFSLSLNLYKEFLSCCLSRLSFVLLCVECLPWSMVYIDKRCMKRSASASRFLVQQR